MGNKFAPELPIIAIAFLINVGLMVPIYLKRRQNEAIDGQYEAPRKDHQIPHSLESLIWNLVIIFVCLSGILVIEKNNRTPILILDEFPNNFYPFYIQFVAQIQPSIFLSFHILTKHGNTIWRALFTKQYEPQNVTSNIFTLSAFKTFPKLSIADSTTEGTLKATYALTMSIQTMDIKGKIYFSFNFVC